MIPEFGIHQNAIMIEEYVLFNCLDPFRQKAVGLPNDTTLLAEHLYAAAGSVGYRLALSAVASRRSERQAAESLLGDRCEALILLGPQASAARLAEIAAFLPLASVARHLQPSIPGVHVVRTADDEGARQAVDHLAALGHREIAHIDGGKAPGSADRRHGYRRGYLTAMKRHGLVENIRILPGGLTAQDGATAADALLAPILSTGEPRTAEDVVAPHLVIRGTTAAPRA